MSKKPRTTYHIDGYQIHRIDKNGRKFCKSLDEFFKLAKR